LCGGGGRAPQSAGTLEGSSELGGFEAGAGFVRTIQELLGHEDTSTTEIYLHVAEIGNGKGVHSPLDLVGMVD
jgi:hypothetical protein